MRTLLFALLLVTTQLSAMENYAWLTHSETSYHFPGDVMRFFGRDTLRGPVHSNDWIATQNVGGLPVFYGRVSTSKPSFRPGSPNPAGLFLGEAPIFNAPEIPFPDTLIHLREAATEQGSFLSLEGQAWYCTLLDTVARFYHYAEGTENDTLVNDYVDIALRSWTAVVFVDGDLDLRGELNPVGCQLLLGCSRDIRLVDNLIIEGTDLNTGILPTGATSRIAVASERGVIVANTIQNGRENCGGGARNHPNCHITITAFIFAIGSSFEFEQMNDVNDPYQGPSPDERGNLLVNGGIAQYWRGYLHRSNRGGTGYNRMFYYDSRNRLWRTGVFEPIDPLEEDWVSPVDNPLFPAQFTLSVAPNPFNASTTIRFTLPHLQSVRARVYDVQGREVMKLADRQYPAGSHVLQFNGESLASGVYFLTFQTADNVSTHKLLLLK